MRYPAPIRRRSKILAAAALAALLAAGCKGSAGGGLSGLDDYTIPISDARLSDAVRYRAGSYWIYQDSASGQANLYTIDGWANENAHATHANGKDTVWIVEACNAYATSVSGGERARLSAREQVLGFGFSDHGFYTGGICLALPFVPGQQVALAGGPTDSYAIAHYDSFAVLGRPYADVYEMLTHQGANEVRTFYAMSVGIVRFEHRSPADTQVWNLAGYQVVK